MVLQLSKGEIETILDWYEYSSKEMFRFGGGEMVFASDQSILASLESGKSNFTFCQHDLERIIEWMDTAINKRYGSEKYLFGFEQILYFKLKKSVRSFR